MTFANVRIPDDIEVGAEGGPRFRTTVLTLSSGFEKRNIDWERSRGLWDIGYGVDKKETLETVLAFFYARQGRANAFRFKDWTDFEIGNNVTDTPQEIAIADGIKKKFQTVRRYVSGPTTFDRAITRLVAGTPEVFLNSVKQTSGFTIDIETGIITFTVAPANTVSVGIACEFDNPVRFNQDELDLQAFRSDIFSAPRIELIEIRERLGSLV